jgi:hypothetical protein
MVVLYPLSHPSCLAASIVSFLGLSQARLFLLVLGGRFIDLTLPKLCSWGAEPFSE